MRHGEYIAVEGDRRKDMKVLMAALQRTREMRFERPQRPPRGGLMCLM